MNSWVNGFLGMILDRSLEELFGAIVLSLILSIAGAWLGLWLSRSRKDAIAPLTGVMLVVALLAMALGATLIQNSLPAQQTSHQPSTFSMNSGPPAFYQMLLVLDANGDGKVDDEEFRKAAVALGTDHLAFPDGESEPSVTNRPLPSIASGAAAAGGSETSPEVDELQDPLADAEGLPPVLP